MIDWQRDFLEEGGFAHCLGNDVSVLRPAVGPARALLAAARAAGLTVVHTIESHKADLSDLPPNKLRRCAKIGQVADAVRGRMLIRGEPGNELIPELAPLADELVVYKPGKGAFYATGLEEQLRALGVTHLIFSGVTTEVCVQTSMREANDRGFDCLLVADATESYFPEFKASVLEQVVAQGGIIGWTADSSDVIRAMQEAVDAAAGAEKQPH
jgi:nicotinamidase-related amidase